jgi:hypothetical protein
MTMTKYSHLLTFICANCEYEQSRAQNGWKIVVDRIRGLRARAFWRFLKKTEKARALGHGLELLKNADTGHYTQFLEE